MIYKDIRKFKLPDGWMEKAHQALEDIKEKPPAERIEAINQKSRI